MHTTQSTCKQELLTDSSLFGVVSAMISLSGVESGSIRARLDCLITSVCIVGDVLFRVCLVSSELVPRLEVELLVTVQLDEDRSGEETKRFLV